MALDTMSREAVPCIRSGQAEKAESPKFSCSLKRVEGPLMVTGSSIHLPSTLDGEGRFTASINCDWLPRLVTFVDQFLEKPK